MRIPALKLPIKRGALLAAANWPVVVLQFIAEATFKILLAVPIVGGTFLVALALNQDVQDVLGDELDLRESATGVATSLLEHPVALVSFLSALGIVVVGGSALMFILKGGTLAVMVAGAAACRPARTVPRPARACCVAPPAPTWTCSCRAPDGCAHASSGSGAFLLATYLCLGRRSTSPSSWPGTARSARRGSWSAGP